MDTPLITIFGASGAQGGGLARALLARNKPDHRVRAVTRKPGSDAARELAQLGAEVVEADLDDADSVLRAIRGRTRRLPASPTSGSTSRRTKEIAEAGRTVASRASRARGRST